MICENADGLFYIPNQNESFIKIRNHASGTKSLAWRA